MSRTHRFLDLVEANRQREEKRREERSRKKLAIGALAILAAALGRGSKR